MDILLPIHIFAGSLALIFSAMALSSAKGKKLHVFSSKAYVWCMAAIFFTALPMAIISDNIFLLLIALFSFYLAFAGMRFAANRQGIATNLDWFAIGIMLLSGISMWMLSVLYFIDNNSAYIPLVLFGCIATALGFAHFKSYHNKKAVGQERIARHLTNMMGGTISVVTAVLVVNVSVEPVWIW
tara:strand:+ start:6335 stop:6886 length:552 start_codon:yes stop_codon:yes gene_type:complete